MFLRIAAGALGASAVVALAGSLPAGPAAACNRVDGCIHDAQIESYGMMHDGRMSAAMRSGAANIEAFREMQPDRQPSPSQPAQQPRRSRRN